MSDAPRTVAAVVLAAGSSTRLGVPKQLIRFRGEPLVLRAARAASDAGAMPVVVVIGADAADVARALEDAPFATTVANERWRDGLASSLAAGIREAQRLDARIDAVLIVAADQPLVDGAALRRLLDAFSGGARLVAAEYAATIGVPAVIGREHLDAVLAPGGDAGAGRWLRAQGAEVQRVPLPGAAMDIDTAEDAAMLASLASTDQHAS